ncbi:MAG: nucleoside deaminase, partial [Flammeovirgaceae bacterium]|nr:nucleoside deaminase [Flammeovirgaceae bacterium]
LAITAAQNYLSSKYLDQCTMYLTLEPCTMCAGALFWSQMGALVIGARDLKRGFSLLKPVPLHPKTKVSFGMLEVDCEAKIKDFFKKMRDKQKER